MEINKEELKQIFLDNLEIKNVDFDNLNYRDPGWDSVSHMVLISAIEDKYDIMLDVDDVIALSSFNKCVEILSKY